ncbi:MAG: efflux RND transporter periplasmic adaptor subunit [Alphaproteobacteria bacterium]
MRRLMIVAPVLVLILAGIAIALLMATAPKPEKKDQGPRPVGAFIEPVKRESVRLEVITQGEVRPRKEIDLVPQVSGRIVHVAPQFVDGGIIEEGQLLVRIEDADYKLGVVRARARVADAEQALEREKAEAELARQDWEELGEGTASPLTLRQPQLDRARAQLASARADLADAQLKLDRTRIEAPFDGRVRQKHVDAGQFVTAGTKLGRIFSTGVVEVRLPLTDRELALLNLPVAFAAPENGGPAVHLSASVAGEWREWHGRIVRTESAIDPSTRVLYAIAEVSDPYGEGSDEGVPLAVGLFVDARIEGREIPDALVIPRAGLRGEDEVYVVNDSDELEVRKVQVISSSPERAILRSGVEAGERVIVSVLPLVRNGMKIEPLTGNAGAAQTARGAE